MTAAIHQFIPMLHRHDAVGGHTMALRVALRAAGHPSEIYVEVVDPQTEADTRLYRSYDDDAADGDVLIYQFATRSDIVGWIRGRPEPLVLNYHSVTPPEAFRSWNNGIALLQASCLLELEDLAPKAALGVADSGFDETELRAAGCKATTVVPVLSVNRQLPEPDPAMLDRLRREPGGPRWLSVGRLAPNKCHHEAIAALFAARATGEPDSRLTIVGAPSEPNYAAALRRYADELGLADAVQFLTGLSDAELAACYRTADVLVMLSDHEGFGVPLVEAMRLGVPVVAREGGAVPETLGAAGVLLTSTRPRAVAGAVRELHADAARRSDLVAAGHAQLDRLGLATAGDRLVAAIEGLEGVTSH